MRTKQTKRQRATTATTTHAHRPALPGAGGHSVTAGGCRMPVSVRHGGGDAGPAGLDLARRLLG